MLDLPTLINGGVAVLVIVLVVAMVGMALTATLPTDPDTEEAGR